MVPVYQQIINTLNDRISSGEYGTETKLPSEKELMSEFSTSRITVTRALQEMESRGIIYRLKGKGSFVSTDKKEQAGCAKIISLVLPHKENFFSGGQQYSRQISKSCQNQGYLCSIHYSENSSRKEKQILKYIEDHNVAGAIIYPISNKNVDTLSRMKINGFPIVLLDRKLRELNLPAVTSDNFNGAYDAVSRLTAAGHRRIAFVGAMDSDVVSHRYQAYCRALTDAKIALNPEIAVTSFSDSNKDEQPLLSRDEAESIMRRLIKKDVTAVFCVNDLVAYMLYNAARTSGLDVPANLSIVGFDYLKAFSNIEMDLTTVAQNFRIIAEKCVSTVVDIIENGPSGEPEHIIVPTKFINGGTLSSI